MRNIISCVVLAATFACMDGLIARAADLDYGVLRGAEEDVHVGPINWGGVYFGGHGGYTSGSFGFRNTGRDIVANALRQTVIENELGVSTLLGPSSVRDGGTSYGGFAGYNFQLDETVVGIEVDYTRFDVGGTSGDDIGRQATTSNGFHNFYNLASLSSTKVQDYGTIRARAGYALDNVMPFVTAGLAIGRAHISDQVGIQTYGYDAAAVQQGAAFVNSYGYRSFNPTNIGASIPASPDFYGRQKTKVVGGVALGGGIEYAITSNILLRGEYQYVLFNDFDGHKVNLNTVRGGAAVKF